MASSSSSWNSAPASSSRSWEYQVFLSFRGEDTRKTFVDHLYSALEQRLIRTYKDDIELPRGNSIGPSLLKAIDESHIAVIIFSKNYAESSWCLDELEYIMRCRNERGQVVMPIFYDVSPSEVRKQKGEFGKAFAKLGQENIFKAESWKKALVDASNLAGWEPRHMANGHESQCIKKIVDAISKTLFPSNIHVEEGLVGMSSRSHVLKSKIKIGSGGVRMVGIWGIGGGGKTTLATAVYMEISRHFEVCCIIDNIREESSNIDGLRNLQSRLLRNLLKTHVEVQSVILGKHMIKNMLCRSKVLILLDDVNELKQLEALAGAHNWFGDGSRIIITTRDHQLLIKHRVDEVSTISLLSHTEAIKLFNQHAYHEDKPVEDYVALSLRVVSYAAGLPLAIIVLGSFLYDKDKSEWMSTLDRLEDIPETEIVDKLKISYDGLKDVEKELFLDIACFFRRTNKDEAIEALNACGFHPGIGVTVLIQKSLLSISNGMFDMHDLIQEMGVYIVRGEYPDNPEKHSRLWRTQEIADMCSGDATKENDKIEAIRYRDDPSCFPKFVSNMKKLRFLYMDRFAYDCSEVSEGPKFLSDELRYIYWRGYPATPFPESFQLRKLAVLRLDHSLQKELWKGYKYLPNLRTIKLVRLLDLIKTPDFDGLPNLETFALNGASQLREIHPSIGRLERLVSVIIQGCNNLKMFPPITSKKLDTVVLSGSNELLKASNFQQNMRDLRFVNFDGEEVVMSYNIITERCVISVHNSAVPKNLKKKQYCRDFLVTCLTCRSNLDDDPEDLIDAESLINQEPSLPPNNIINHIWLHFAYTSIRKLVLRWCNLIDENICCDVFELSNLQELDLRGNEFSQLNFSLLQLPRLKWLDVSSCTNLVQLSQLPSSIAILIADNCWSLESVGCISNCKWLWKVSLMGNNKVGLLGGDILLDSIFEGNAIDQHFISFSLTDLELWKGFLRDQVWGKRFKLLLPHNWHNDFCGFRISTVSRAFDLYINMNVMQEVDEDCQSRASKPDYHCQSQVSGESIAACNPDHSTIYVGYVSFSSLKHIAWYNPACNMIVLSLRSDYGHSIIAELVPKRCKGDPIQRKTAATDCSEFWEERDDSKTFAIKERDDSKTFAIKDSLNSSINILWRPCYWD